MSMICFSQRPIHNRVVYKPVNLNIIEDSIVKKDSLDSLYRVIEVKEEVIHSQNRAITAKENEIEKLKKPTTKSFMDWGCYIIAWGLGLLLFVLSFIKTFQNSKWVLIQRLASETTPFWNKVQYYCGSAALIIPFFMGYLKDSISDYSFNVLGVITTTLLVIAGTALFTKKDSTN